MFLQEFFHKISRIIFTVFEKTLFSRVSVDFLYIEGGRMALKEQDYDAIVCILRMGSFCQAGGMAKASHLIQQIFERRLNFLARLFYSSPNLFKRLEIFNPSAP